MPAGIRRDCSCGHREFAELKSSTSHHGRWIFRALSVGNSSVRRSVLPHRRQLFHQL